MKSSPLVFWNSNSGRSNLIRDLRQALPASSARWVELGSSTNLLDCVEGAVSDGVQTVIAAGGDGTVNVLVNALMTIDKAKRPALAIIPMGTANDFAGTLAIPDDVNEAVELIRSGERIPVDLVHVTGGGVDRYYANMAAGGNCVRVSEALTDELKSRWGAFSYIRGAVEFLSDMKTYRIAAMCDDEGLEDLDSWAVLVANGRTNAGRIEVAPKASPVDGLIDVIIIRDGDVSEMMQIVASNLLGNFLESEQVLFRQVKSFRLQSDPPMRFTLDGEVIDEEPVQFDVVPAAINMHVATQNFLAKLSPSRHAYVANRS